jgi:nucleoside recognition membrane protein YjiH
MKLKIMRLLKFCLGACVLACFMATMVLISILEKLKDLIFKLGK